MPLPKPKTAAEFEAIARRGGAAFPDQHNEGMSLRDWFAGQALAMMPADILHIPYEAARLAYTMADALIAERRKGLPK